MRKSLNNFTLSIQKSIYLASDDRAQIMCLIQNVFSIVFFMLFFLQALNVHIFLILKYLQDLSPTTCPLFLTSSGLLYLIKIISDVYRLHSINLFPDENYSIPRSSIKPKFSKR